MDLKKFQHFLNLVISSPAMACNPSSSKYKPDKLFWKKRISAWAAILPEEEKYNKFLSGANLYIKSGDLNFALEKCPGRDAKIDRPLAMAASFFRRISGAPGEQGVRNRMGE
jgi:hypothetical protein